MPLSGTLQRWLLGFRAALIALAVAALATGCQTPLTAPDRTGLSSWEARRPDAQLAAAGASIYGDICANCHGVGGLGSDWAPALTTIALDVGAVSALITAGVDPPSMPSFAGLLNEAEIRAVAAYTVALRYSSSAG